MRDFLISPLESIVSDAFDNIFKDRTSVIKRAVDYPRMDVYEKDNKYIVDLSVPGVKKDNLKIELKDNLLTITGEMSEEYKSRGSTVYINELRRGKFIRQLKIPEYLKDEPKVKLADGILSISWDNIQKPPQVKLLEINEVD